MQFQQSPLYAASSSMQRGHSTKHARSKSTSTAQNLIPLDQVHQRNTNNPYQYQQNNIPLAYNHQDMKLNNYAMAPQIPDAPKRTLKPKDLNNYNLIPTDPQSRKCATPLDKDSRATKPLIHRASSKEQQRKAGKFTGSPEKYYSSHQSRTISHTHEGSQKPTTKTGAQSVSVSKQPNSYSTYSTTTINGGASLRGSQQSKLNTSIQVSSGSNFSKTNPAALLDMRDFSSTGLVLLPSSSSSQTYQRKPSSGFTRNVPIPKYSHQQSSTPSAQPLNSGSNYQQLNQSFNQNYYSSVNNANAINANTMKPVTRQHRANKSLHNAPSFNVSSSSTASNLTSYGNSQLNGGILNNNAYSYLYQTQQPSLQHHRSSSNYQSAAHPQFHEIILDPQASQAFNQPSNVLNPGISLYNQNNGIQHFQQQHIKAQVVPSGSLSNLTDQYHSHNPGILQLSFSKDEEDSFINQQARFPYTSQAHSSNTSQNFGLPFSTQNSASIQSNQKKLLTSQSASYNQQLFPQQHQQPQAQQQQHQHQPVLNERSLELLAKGKALFKENNIEEALKLFSTISKEEPMLLECQYLLGVCYLSSGIYQKAIEEFCDILEKNENYKRNIYMLIAIAYKKTSVINAAIQILGKAIQQYPKYYDAYIYRGKLQVKMKRFDKAISDFDIAIRLNGTCGLGYMGKADCLRFMNEFDKAVNLYTEALQKEESISKVAILKRAITQIEGKQFAAAKQDLEMILSEDPCNSEAFYFKGMLYYKQKNVNEAILSFEQAIKHNNSRKAVTKALYEIAKIKIEQRDFYQAYHTLQRSDYLDVDVKSLEKFSIFTDGVTFLMKRKHKEGMKKLSNLVKNFSLGDFLKPLVYIYRAYGYFCLGKHQKGLSDLKIVEEIIQKPEQSTQYNRLICEGIILASSNQFDQAVSLFNKASKICPQRMEPEFYKGMTQIQYVLQLVPKSDEAKRLQYFQNAIKNFDRAVELNSSNSNLYFQRGVLKFSMNQISECLGEFNLAIEKAEENQGKHHYARGLAYACCGYVSQAVQELSYALQQDGTIANAFLNRAKCFHLLGEKNSAFVDIQSYLGIKQSDASTYQQAGNVLFTIGAYSDAIKAYSNASDINTNAEILLLRAKCYMVFKELNWALEDMDRIIELKTSISPYMIFDKLCLSSLKTASAASASADPEVQQSSFSDALITIKQAKGRSGVQTGKCFLDSDYHFFKGVYFFYLSQFQRALKHFKRSFEIKSLESEKERARKLDDLEHLIDQDSSDIQDPNALSPLHEYDFQNRTYNIYEYYFNCAACHIMLNDYESALHSLFQLQTTVPDEQCIKKAELLIQILTDEAETTKTIIKNKVEMDMFPVKNRLCSIFPKVLPNFQVYPEFTLNLYFCLPNVEAPSVNPCFDDQLLEQMKPTAVENKPEAPWIRRTSEGIIFTENVQHFDDLDLKTETARGSPSKNEQEQIQILDEEQIESKLNQKISASQFKIDLKNDNGKAPTNKINSRVTGGNSGKQRQNLDFDYDELMNDHSHYLYQDYKDIDYSYDGEEAVYKQSPKQVVDKSRLKELLKLDDNIEKKLAKISKKNTQDC